MQIRSSSGKTDRMPISCAILAGGKSRRMGVEKAFLELGGLTIIERVINTVKQVASEILIVTNDPKNFTHLETQDIPINIVKDIYPGVGALGGLHSGLCHATHEMVFVSACDMPLINPDLIRFVTNASANHDAAVPIINNYYEPLIAAYSKNCIEAIEEHIDKGDRQILSFYKDVKLREVTEVELKTVDKDLLSFININKPEDLINAEQLFLGTINMKRNIPIISVVGYSNSGKTTYLEKLIPELSGRGYKVCAIKHDVHGFDIDVPGKDSHRLKSAGAHTTILSSPSKIAMIADVENDMKLSELRDRFITGIDIIVTEGYKSDIHPKIEVFRGGIRDELLAKEDDTLFAVASDTKADTTVPVLSINDAKEMADLIEERFLYRHCEE